jgi:hypothetical protein
VLNFMGASGTAEKHQEDGPAQHQQRRQGLDLSTLQAFRAYIYPSESGPKWDEVTLLRRLEREWRDKVRAGHNGKGGNTTLLFAARDRAFLTWIELRRHLADLTHADECRHFLHFLHFLHLPQMRVPKQGMRRPASCSHLTDFSLTGDPMQVGAERATVPST